jgi:hypothetical protein
MALVRELIRRNKRHLRLMPAPGSIAPDMLNGRRCVAEPAACSSSLSSSDWPAFPARRRNRQRQDSRA